MRSSKAAFDLIVEEEVSSRATYEKKYRKPEWPGASSGATVGIGYDLGQTGKDTIRADWLGRVSQSMLNAMLSASGATGAAGKTMTAKVRNQIDIPWDVALAVHEECVIPRWEARVAKALPNTDRLSADCFGALLSLTFNRGPSFSNSGERYREMRNIKAHMASGNFVAIPNEFRAMKRLWPNLKGLLRRRDREAALFQRGLSAPIARPIPKPSPVPAPPDIEPIDIEPADKSDPIDQKPAASSSTVWVQIGSIIAAIGGALTDWKVAAVIGAVALAGLTIYLRVKKPDMKGWF
jgi:hypothetical protein